MFISPQTAIDKGWIRRTNGEPIAGDFIQPNAIDFTIDRIFSANDSPVPFIAADVVIEGALKTLKSFPEFEELTASVRPFEGHAVNFFECKPGAYDFLSDFYVEVPEGVAALLIVRSTFNRGSNFVTSGLYDSGFKGNIGAALHVRSSAGAYIGKGTRIGQIIFVSSDSVGTYAGGYNTAEGAVAAQHMTASTGPH